MEKKQFQAESKRLLDIVINSVYTHREIFLRELISNSSDAIDKVYYKTLQDENLVFNKEDYYIKINIDKNNRKLIIEDTGIGMNDKDLENNLGVIARSGSLKFKKENQMKDEHDIIGQFGIGFYSAFLVANKVEVISKALGEDKAYRWLSEGVEGYTIEETTKEKVGTTIILELKENDEDENFDEYLDEYRLKSIIKRYSDFIRYPINMDITTKKLKEGSDNDFEDVLEEQTINSMVPIWRRNKNELTNEDYNNFYSEKHYGFDTPLTHIHAKVDGKVSYNSIMFIPENVPFDFYTKEYKKGLELYTNGVMIMEKCEQLLPDYFGFVKGIVDSQDLSLNISREILQHDRQLKFIAKNIKNKIKNELKSMLKNDREKYEKFYNSFGKQLKYGIYNDFGKDKDILKDLIMFYSSKEDKLVTLKEYVDAMKEDQKHIYYASGESNERIKKMPQAEVLLDKGYEILFFTDEVDEFAIRMLNDYEEKEFKSISSSDLDLEEDNIDQKDKEDNKKLFEEMKTFLTDKVKSVKASNRLKNHPVCLSNDGELSIEMEKILNTMPNNQNLKADKILEVNINHDVFKSLKDAYEKDNDKFKLYTDILYNQALLIEGLSINDPVEFTNNICKIMK
ncbi:MAG: molecular chaperone HtpG [Peptostreptococcaceae bacterium]|nr:molecular chaperone HtpG [Peptostreptococcaceae bacterium]